MDTHKNARLTPKGREDLVHAVVDGGEGGIRTPDTVARMPHFECGAFNHSATSPRDRNAMGERRAVFSQGERGRQERGKQGRGKHGREIQRPTARRAAKTW